MTLLEKAMVWFLRKRGIIIPSETPPDVQRVLAEQRRERERFMARMAELDRMAEELGLTPLVRQVEQKRHYDAAPS